MALKTIIQAMERKCAGKVEMQNGGAKTMDTEEKALGFRTTRFNRRCCRHPDAGSYSGTLQHAVAQKLRADAEGCLTSSHPGRCDAEAWTE